MATLNRLELGSTADGDEVTGTGAAGNDQQLKTLLSGVRLRHKRNRWANRVEFVNSMIMSKSASGVNDPQVIYGRAEAGMWLKTVFINVKHCMSTDATAANAVTVRMVKDTTTNVGSDTINSTAVDLIPTTSIRCIQGVDDDTYISLPIEMDYIATGEYWTLMFNGPSDTAMGIDEASVLIQFAELHRT
tara:strand:- start:141 stop:707 length:567 start_codon:yes stop_codon:yes gene_type:complete